MRLRLVGELLGWEGLELATGVRAHDFLEGQRVLWDKTRSSYESSLQAVGCCVRLLIDRLSAEIPDDSLHVALQQEDARVPSSTARQERIGAHQGSTDQGREFWNKVTETYKKYGTWFSDGEEMDAFLGSSIPSL